MIKEKPRKEDWSQTGKHFVCHAMQAIKRFKKGSDSRYSVIPGDICGCHNLGGRGVMGVRQIEAKDAAKRPTLRRTAPHIWPKMSTVLRLGNLNLEKYMHTYNMSCIQERLYQDC